MSLFTILRAEWTRFLAHPVYRWIMITTALLLVGSALWSGAGVRGYRAEVATQQAQWHQAREQAIADAPDHEAARGKETEAVNSAYAVGRGDLGATRMAATGAAVLGFQQYSVLPAALRATVESRHTDGRVSGALGNPLLAETGLPSFPAMAVLLLSLAALALTAGMVQEDRERGIWRLVCAQCSVGPATVFAMALLVRWFAVSALGATASLCAFALDPDAAAAPFMAWLSGLAAFVAFWVLASGLMSLLPVSAGAAMTGALGLWLMLTFAVPAAVAWAAERAMPMPSRLALIVQLRTVQMDTEAREAELLAAWYAAHPDQRPLSERMPSTPGWPVTFMPRFLEQEARLRPSGRAFDEARARQAAMMEQRAWLSPPLALMMLADRLAGADAQRYARYVDAVDRFEDRWRAFFMQRIMAYRGLTRQDFAAMPVFAADEAARIDAVVSEGPAPRCLAIAVAVLALLVFAGRRSLYRP